jgi:hypothetical protein
MFFNGKEIIVLVIGTALAFASFKTNDPVIFFPCIGASWAAFVYICATHPGPLLLRVLIAVSISCVFVFVSFRIYTPPQSYTPPQPTGLKMVIALTGINEEKDLTASADGAAICLFNDGPSALKDLHEILRFPALKSAEVEDKYKSRVSITGGGKPGSDYVAIEIPELPPTERVFLGVAFAEKQKVTSVEAWASQYGYAKDNIQVQQGFLGKERRVKP